jgi:enoyl-CoA hydratase
MEDNVLSHRQGRAGYITLNRPNALNALTLPMVRGVHMALQVHLADPQVEVIVIRSSSAKAFCAGGDMRLIRELCLADRYDEAMQFFEEEYRLNLAIANCTKPYVAWLDGIAMGGGLGLSVHGRYRIVTERSVLAMPETAIGLFPDVGASHFLPRLPHRAGWWMGLTGARVTGAEALALGLATHYVPSSEAAALTAALTDAGESVDSVLAPWSQSQDAEAFMGRMRGHARFFTVDSLGEVVRRLKSDDGPDAPALLSQLDALSPMALELSWHLLAEGERSSLDECLSRELQAGSRAIRHPDFVEGVRAMLVDKDRRPTWSQEIVD